MQIHKQHAKCYFCGSQTNRLNYVNGLPICEECARATPKEAMLKICSSNRNVDVISLANKCMLHPSIPLHGPEHHYLTSCIFLGWLKALGFKVSDREFKIAIERGSIIPGGSCGSMGLCGAPVGMGVALAVFVRSTPLKAYERTLCMKVVNEGLKIIERIGGIRCCKASTYASIIAASRVLYEELKIGFKVEKIHCIFSKRNTECLKESCPFYCE